MRILIKEKGKLINYYCILWINKHTFFLTFSFLIVINTHQSWLSPLTTVFLLAEPLKPYRNSASGLVWFGLLVVVKYIFNKKIEKFFLYLKSKWKYNQKTCTAMDLDPLKLETNCTGNVAKILSVNSRSTLIILPPQFILKM